MSVSDNANYSTLLKCCPWS